MCLSTLENTFAIFLIARKVRSQMCTLNTNRDKTNIFREIKCVAILEPVRAEQLEGEADSLAPARVAPAIL